MNQHDEEIDYLKANVSCAIVLERLPPVWRLDTKESSRDALKYRRGEGEIIIVNHDMRGWWDPLSTSKGDVFNLVQHLDRNLDFGQARRLLRPLAGLSPDFPQYLPAASVNSSSMTSVAERWAQHSGLVRGSPTWNYLSHERGLPDDILLAAAAADVVREGLYGSAWFAHRDSDCHVVGIDMRGPNFRGFSKGGEKTLFRFAGGDLPPRLAVCEAAIDALSLAAIEQFRGDTLYAATAGGMGLGTVAMLQSDLMARGNNPAAVLVAATDADKAGNLYAERLAELAAAAGVRFERILPPDNLKDWNDYLRAGAPAPSKPEGPSGTDARQFGRAGAPRLDAA